MLGNCIDVGNFTPTPNSVFRWGKMFIGPGQLVTSRGGLEIVFRGHDGTTTITGFWSWVMSIFLFKVSIDFFD